jgi:replicative DNA helicase
MGRERDSGESFENALPKRPTKQGVDIDHLPPHSEDSERGLLGCVLLESKHLGLIIERVKSDPEVFYDLRNQHIYRAMLQMSDSGNPVDIITLQEQLKENQVLEQIGGIPYLLTLQDVVSVASNWSYYADTIIEMHSRRRLIKSCIEIINKAQASAKIESVISDVEKVLAAQSERNLINVLDGGGAANKMVTDLEKRMELNGRLSGLDTGFIDLNSMTEGLQLGEQFVIGARPSQGKTAIGLSMFKHNAFGGIPSLFISCEMSVESIMRRLLSMHMSVPLRIIRRGGYTEELLAKFASFHAACRKHPMQIVDAVSGINIRDLCSKVKRHVAQFGTKFVVVDYLQKIRPSERHEKKTYEVGDISGRLKALAVECNVAMLTLAQLNRENTKEKGRAPRLSDLADSGQIERDADTVGLLYKQPDHTKLIIAKQRDGETGLINLAFDGDFVRFGNYRDLRED